MRQEEDGVGVTPLELFFDLVFVHAVTQVWPARTPSWPGSCGASPPRWSAARRLAVSAALWWTYFDVVAIVAERVLARVDGAERSRLGRDSYSYLHLPMVAGIVLAVFGLHEVLAVVGGSQTVQGHGGEGVGTATVPLGAVLPAVAALVALTTATTTLIAYEALRFGDARERVRHLEEIAASRHASS